jgi:hypothetical protein
MTFVSREGQLAIPREHRFAQKSEITLADIGGEDVAVYPPSIGHDYFEAWVGPLRAAGAVLVEGPEDHALTLLRFAAMRRILCLVHVMPRGEVPSDILETMVLRPIADGAALGVRLMLATERSPAPGGRSVLADRSRDRGRRLKTAFRAERSQLFLQQVGTVKD